MIDQTVFVTPRLVQMPPQQVAVLESFGDPALVANRTVRKLYKEVAAAGIVPSRLRARWLNAHRVPRARWEVRWAVPVPDGVEQIELAHVRLETWYGRPAVEVLHIGALASAGETVARLRRFAHDQGFVIAGPHEEEYLTAPGVEPERTVFRFEVREH